MNEIDAIRLKLQNSNNVSDVISVCKDWRTIILKRIKKKIRKYQTPFSDKIIEFVLSEGSLGDEIIALFARQCIDGNSLVFDNYGNISKIKDVGFSTGIKDVYKVKSGGGNEIISTLNHRFYTKGNGWKTLGEIINNNKYLCGQYKDKWKVEIGDERQETYCKENNISDEKIKLLAYMFSDGYHKNPKQSMKFTNTNRLYIDEFRKCLIKEFNMEGNIFVKGNGWDLLCTDKKYQIPVRKTVKLRLSGKFKGKEVNHNCWVKGENSFRNWIKDLDIKFGFPSIIYKLSRRQFGLFLNRTYSSDGYLSGQEIGLVDYTEKVKVLQMMFLWEGIKSYITEESNGRSRIRVAGKQDIKKFLQLTGFIFGKEKQSQAILDRVNKLKRSFNSKWQSIKSIEYLGKRETFNMHVPIYERYVANGFKVHNSGKTETVAFTVLTLGTFYILFLRQEFLCGLFAPVESMTTHVTRNRVRKMYNMVAKYLEDNGLKLIAGRGVTSSIFILKDKYSEAEFYIRALSVGEQSETIGETFRLIIVEQSELVNALKLTNDVFPMGATKGGCRVLTGTTSPYFKNDYFKSAIQKWNSDPNISKSTADSVIMVDWKEASKESVAYSRYCKKMRDKLGEDNIAFKTQFCLQFVSAAIKFIGWEDLAVLGQDYISNKDNLRFYGIDLARAGDSTVVTVIEKDGLESHIIGWLELQGLDFEDYGIDMKRKGQITKIVEFLKQFKPLRYGLVDKANIGIAPYDMFKKRLWDKELDEKGEPTGKHIAWTRVGAFHASVKENDKMAKCMDREFQHDRIHYPKHTQYRREKNRFIDQILDVDRKYSGYTLKLAAPKTIGSHDDFVISLGLAIYAMKEKTFKGGIANVNM